MATRWLARLGDCKEVPQTLDGLFDTKAVSSEAHTDEGPFSADDLVGTERSYVVLAPGGAGKSTLIKSFKEREAGSQSINLRMHAHTDLPAVISRAVESARSIFIDALDEALQVNSEYGYVLTNALAEQVGAREVAWRLACRPGSWSLDLARGLEQALPGFEELELLPLDHKGITEIAGDDAERFLAAVEQADLTRLLAHPLQAQSLLKQWRSTGALPADRSEAMEHTIMRLLEENGQQRPLPRQQGDQRMKLVAERLGAITLFCGVGHFSPGSAPVGQSSANDAAIVPATAIPVDYEPDLASEPLTIENLREVLGTTLFSAAPDGSLTFAHQTYAEYLSAAYLTRRRVTGKRLVSMLGADVNGLAPGPMIDVLGWMLALGAEVPIELIYSNAKALLGTTGLELASAEVREQVVDGLLRGAANGTIDEGWNLDMSVLAHPRLEAQLRAAAKVAVNRWEVFWIARIARHCSVHALAEDLLVLGHDRSWPTTMRAEAIRSFGDLSPADDLNRLDHFLESGAEEDPDDEILAAALRAMLRGGIAIDRIVSVLRPQRQSNYVGNYAMLLHELPTLIRATDALPLLKAGLVRPAIDDAFAETMAADLLARVWDRGDVTELGEVGALIGHGQLSGTITDRNGPLPWEGDDKPERRRAIALSVLTVAEEALFPLVRFRLLRPSDLTWLIDWMEGQLAPAVESAKPMLRRLALGVARASSVEALPIVDPSAPAHAVLAEVRDSVQSGLEADEALMKSANAQHSLAYDRSLERLRTAIASALSDAEMWWTAVVALAGDRPSVNSRYLWDLTARPLWTALEPAEQEVCWQLAIRHASTRQPDLAWVGRSSWTADSAVLPDWSAVFSIATAAVHQPGLLAALPLEAWQRLAPAIIAMPPWADGERWRAALLAAAPPEGRFALSAALRERVLAGDVPIAQLPISDFVDREVLDGLALVARDTRRPSDFRGDALHVLANQDETTALSIARSMQTEHDPPITAHEVLAALSPEELLAPRLSAGALGSLSPLPHIDLKLLSNGPLVGLTRLLLDKFPFADDPKSTDDFADVTPESEARRLRFSALQEIASRGLTADLETFSVGQADTALGYIRHLMQQAREHEALAKRRPLELNVVMNLINQGDARLVRNSTGLVTVLLEQLERIQEDIHEKNMFRDLWDLEPGSEGAKLKGEEHISDWLKNQLQLRLSRFVVVDREIQVTRHKGVGSGTRIDITVTAPNSSQELCRVLFEAKLVTNDSLLTALDDQLVKQYMEPERISHGIYIVYWAHPSKRPTRGRKKHPRLEDLSATLREQAHHYRPGKNIEAVVLDVGPKVASNE